MTGPVVVGFDGSPESVAATEWAAREAQRRNSPLAVLHAWPSPRRDTADYHRSAEQLAAREAALRADVDVPVTSAHTPAAPAEALEAAGRDAALLVLGSRGLGAVRGFLVGSVSQEVLRRADCPVVLVRAGGDEPDGPVLVGLDLAHPGDDVLAFAFDAAARRSAPLRIVHVWSPPVGSEYLALEAIGGLADGPSAAERARFTELVEPWRARRPEVDVTADLVRGSATVALVDAAAGARLLVVGRRVRRHPLGTHLGPVAHAAIHHVHCPVALVRHA
ncbi:universal stress protein [Streptomyces sp. NRRL S-350]|uniref:universal stress protein n=1 Tax=Streptomyces sp. NRRL S-350 TaxID=1463902 RepID=UPI0004C24902|nr:universal stress protein [Streptomyces sp. NRRL S-350]